MLCRPTSTRSFTTMPPPTPVPTITPNTMECPAPAPSTASDRAKQLASFSTFTSRPSEMPRSRAKGCPFSQVELAFLTSPVSGLTAPGMPTPTLADPFSSVSTPSTRSRMVRIASP